MNPVKCHHSNESYRAVHSCGVDCFLSVSVHVNVEFASFGLNLGSSGSQGVKRMGGPSAMSHVFKGALSRYFGITLKN